LKIGIKTSAITFGRFDVLAVMLCYAASGCIALAVGWQYGLHTWFLGGLLVAGGCALYHFTLIRERERLRCFAAFRHNNWLGAAVFAGIALNFALL
ncbi:MAG TPA: 4-hydroxybenzoate octaprenyltransferase, partial [Burkholderiaceae bacterium]|nr:4-hydroxybenzoate octaprenyltransferase [Burkholderiaceae bacterium]